MFIIIYRNGTKTLISIPNSESKKTLVIHQATLQQFLIDQWFLEVISGT